MPSTKRVSKCAAIPWVCLLALVVIVRVTNLVLVGIKPEAVMLTFMMTLPFSLGATVLIISSASPGFGSANAFNATPQANRVL